MRGLALGLAVLFVAGCSEQPAADESITTSTVSNNPSEGLLTGPRYRVNAPTATDDRIVTDVEQSEAPSADTRYAPVRPFVISTETRRAAARLVEDLTFERYKQRIETLSGFGYRRQGSKSFDDAAEWLVAELAAAGYTVHYHDYEYRSEPRQNIYVTKVGTEFPDRMFILSAHLDGLLLSRSTSSVTRGGAADDDASGVALVLEAALAFAPVEVETAASVRFIFWNNEETGLFGSRAYVADRAEQQGKEVPAGSGLYPEPTWVAMIQHDMLLFDHGYPPGPDQRPDADLDIEFRGGSAQEAGAIELAAYWQASNANYSTDYPAEVGDGMSGTDSVSFHDVVPAISIRENKRRELVSGWNPNWHQPSDVYETYSDADYRLGFNALQMSVGAVAELAGASLDSL